MSNDFNQTPNPAPVQDAEVQNAVAAALVEQKKKKRKKRIIIFAVIAAVIIIIGVAASGGDKEEGKSVQPIDGAQTTAAQAEQSEEPAAAPEKVKAGNVVTTDKLKISYVSCNANYTKYNEYMGPEKGNKVIRAEFKFENISSSDVSLESFECYADDKKCEEFYGADDYASPTLESVSPGRSFDAVIYFEVPKDAETIDLELEDDFWSSEKTIFVVK